MSTARDIRRVIGHIDGAWVRVWRDGDIWAGVRQFGQPRDAGEVEAALRRAGYTVKRPSNTEIKSLDVFLPKNQED